eukprot:363724-Chlamydomonas_euryale.AAC.5
MSARQCNSSSFSRIGKLNCDIAAAAFPSGAASKSHGHCLVLPFPAAARRKGVSTVQSRPAAPVARCCCSAGDSTAAVVALGRKPLSKCALRSSSAVFCGYFRSRLGQRSGWRCVSLLAAPVGRWSLDESRRALCCRGGRATRVWGPVARVGRGGGREGQRRFGGEAASCRRVVRSAVLTSRRPDRPNRLTEARRPQRGRPWRAHGGAPPQLRTLHPAGQPGLADARCGSALCEPRSLPHPSAGQRRERFGSSCTVAVADGEAARCAVVSRVSACQLGLRTAGTLSRATASRDAQTDVAGNAGAPP